MVETDGYNSLINIIPCGIFDFYLSQSDIVFTDVNAKGSEMSGYSKEELVEKKWKITQLFYKQDVSLIENILNELHQTLKNKEYTYRLMRKDGKNLWVKGFFRVAKIEENKYYFQIICLDIDKQKQAEDALILEQDKMDVVLSNFNITEWNYDVENEKCINSERQHNLFGVENLYTPEDFMKSGRLSEEGIEDCKYILNKAKKSTDLVHTIIKFLDDEGETRYARFTIKKTGEEAVALGWTEDVTASMLNHQKLMDEIERQDSANSDNLVAKGRFDLTTNVVEKYRADENVAVGNVGQSYDEWCEELYKTVVKKDQLAVVKNTLNRMKAIGSYEKGDNTTSVEFQRKLKNGRQIWCRTSVRIYPDMDKNHIKLFLYCHNISRDKIIDEVVRRFDRTDSEMLGVLYPENDLLFIVQSKIDERENQEIVFSETLESYIEKYIAEECRKDAKKALSKVEIMKQLMTEKNYSVSFPENRNGTTYQKNWNFYYIDDTVANIVVNRSDVTELFAQQEKQREIIETALLSAKQASEAKSNFLSRMSHEIRTPMNAILGMCTLAAQAIGNDDEVSDCISKIGISGHYLLSLINDILDMSRIESGKMSLHIDTFHMDEFVADINTVIYGQTQQKKIDYETIIDANLSESYLGDAMKLQQIMVNILGNAIKFTMPNGRITFAIHAGKPKNNIQNVVFTINDTGCGIKPEALNRIFEPFEQEDGSITSEFGGTGLGLAICKNLAELMGGSVSCRSIVGVGSEFTVTVPLEVTAEVANITRGKYTFEKLKTLIVDDDLVVCETTAKTLEQIGMVPEWVCSGMEAIERVKSRYAQNKTYDYILIDWKMPEMDGIETTRRIRKIVGPEVTIIIITAYDWISIEREAKLAGVNMCISKPMFRSTLISAFQKTIELNEKQEKKKDIKYDFNGAKILLAEDHAMNAEIATRLLKSKNCQIEVVENGLLALEMFSTKPVGYYSAILMDVRMPIMDGLQAASNIRRWNKADAKTIPIIAMTANAFDEDVQKCRTAGMDAHLAKPIEPELLYHTLMKQIMKRDN